MPCFLRLDQTTDSDRDRDSLIDSVCRDRWVYRNPSVYSLDSLDVLCGDGSVGSSHTIYDEVRRSARCGLSFRLLTLLHRNVKNMLPSFIRKLVARYGIRSSDDGDIYCSQGNILKATTYARYESRDLNRLLTANLITRNYDKKFNAGWKVGTTLRGRTSLGEFSFPFPVSCSTREFVCFLEAMDMMPRSDRISMLVNGTVPNQEVERLYLRIFPRTTYASVYMDTKKLFEGIKVLSTFMLIFEAIKDKNIPTLGMLFAQNLDTVEVVARYMGVAFSNFREYIIDYFHDDNIKVYASDGASSWVSLLPGVVRQSPLVQKVIALATFLFSAQFLRESSLWEQLTVLVGPDFSKVTERALGAALFYQVVMALWEGYKRMSDYSDWEGLLGLSKDAAFLDEVRAMQTSRPGSYSKVEVTKLLHRIDELFKMRRGLVNSPAVERCLSFLVEKKKELLILEDHYSPRDLPVVIWLNGPPGTGKTTLLESIKDFLAVQDEVPRKLGDTIMYDIYDPWPVEASATWDARYMVINDVPAGYESFAKEGKVPLDVVLQKVLDTSPLTFPAAFEKGVIYTRLKYLFISSNHYSYKFSSDCERLQRRLDRGILMDYTFKDGKTAEWVRHRPVDERNDHVSFIELRAKCDNLHLSFTRTQRSFTVASVFSHITDVIAEHNEANRISHIAIKERGLCACGLTRAFHLHLGNPVGISPKCDIAPYTPKEYVIQSTEELRCKCGLGLGLHICGGLCDLNETACADDEEEKTNDPDVNRMLEHYYPSIPVKKQSIEYTTYCAILYWMWKFCNSTVVWTWKEWFLSLLVEIFMWNYCNMVIYGYEMLSFLLLKDWVGWQQWVKSNIKYYILRQAVNSVKAFLRKHAVAISVLGVTAIVGVSMTRKKTTHVSTQGVNRLNYNKSSLTTTMISTDQRMPSNARTWTNPSPINRIELVTRHVNEMDLCVKVALATAPAIFLDSTNTRMSGGYVFFLNADIMCVNRHYLTEEVNGVWNFRPATACKINGIEFLIHACDIMYHPSTEICCVPNVTHPCAENLSKFLPKSVPNCGFDAVYAPTKEKCIVKYENATLENGETYGCMGTRLDTAPGDCGQVLVGTVNGEAFIAGLLFAGASQIFGHRSFFCGIPAQEMPSFRVIIPEPDNLDVLSGNSEIRNDPHAAIIPLGSNPLEGNNHFRTAFRKTRLYDSVYPKLSVDYSIITKIAGNVSKDGGYVHGSAWKSTFKRFDLFNYHSKSIFRIASSAYADRICKAPEVKLAPLSLEEAFFGLESIGVEGFPLDTSAGPFWRKKGFKKKRDLFSEDKDGTYVLEPLFVQAVQTALDNLESEVVVAPHVELAAKDEIRPTTKVEAFNVRLFSVVDADYNIVIRMYIMPLIAYLLKHKEFSECFGQMHAASHQWTDLRNYLCSSGNTKFADMDFSSFDTCHDVKVFEAVAYAFMRVAIHVGYTEGDAGKVYGLVKTMSVQLCQYKGDYFVKTKGMPSGVILTLIMNSMANSILMRIVFSILTLKPASEFDVHVKLATVGDDNIHSISDEISESFTMSRAADIYESLGYTITPASKAGVFVDNMCLEDLTFVKRKFVLWEDGMYRAPLDTDSIFKAFCFETNRSGESSVERLKSVYTSGLYEAYLHGEAFFQKYVADMSKIYDEHELEYDELSFEELDNIFKSRGLVTLFA